MSHPFVGASSDRPSFDKSSFTRRPARTLRLTVIAAAVGFLTVSSAWAEEPETAKHDISRPLSESAMKVSRRTDGSVAVSGGMHGGRGVEASIVIPKVTPEIRMTGPAGKDENGRPITEAQKLTRERADAIVFQGLKARGYTLEKAERDMKGIETAPQRWKRHGEEAAGKAPATSRHFVLPGADEATGDFLSDPDTGVRVEGGRIVYYRNGKRISTDGSSYGLSTAGTRSGAPTAETLRLKIVKKPGNAESAGKAAPPPAVLGADGRMKAAKPLVPAEKRKLPAVRQTAPVKTYQPRPEDDLRRDALTAPVDEKTLPGPEDVEKRLREAFPDMTRPADKLSRTAEPAFNPIERLTAFLTGTRTARAAEADFSAAVKSIAERRNTLAEKQVMKTEPRPVPSAVPEKQRAGESDAPLFLDAARNSGFDAIRHAERAAGLRKRTDDAFVSGLESILDAHPEIYRAVPDAAKKLLKRKGRLAELSVPDSKGDFSYVFISYSLGEETIRDILKRWEGRHDVAFVMRGVPEGLSIPEGIRRLQALASEVAPSPSVVIDPPLFTRYGITEVPSVVRTGRPPEGFTAGEKTESRREYPDMLAKVSGLATDRWLIERMLEGERGDLGVQGSVRPVAEPDLIADMKRRTALVDWQKKKEDAVKRYWKKKSFRVYPTAPEERIREIDPTIIVKQDLTDLSGKAIRRAGDLVNPLNIRPFTQTMVIFNPTSEDETARIEAFIAGASAESRAGVVLIASEMDRDRGWQGYRELTNRFDAHVYLMTPEVETRWQIEKTPSVVTADNAKKRFIVRELGPLEKEEKTK